MPWTLEGPIDRKHRKLFLIQDTIFSSWADLSSLKKAILAKLRSVRFRGGEGKGTPRGGLGRGVPLRPANPAPVQGKIAHFTALFKRRDFISSPFCGEWREMESAGKKAVGWGDMKAKKSVSFQEENTFYISFLQIGHVSLSLEYHSNFFWLFKRISINVHLFYSYPFLSYNCKMV